MIKTQLFIGAALLVGVAVGYFCDKSPRPSAATPEAAASARGGTIADKGEEASLKALRRRIAELERQLAERPDAVTVVTNVVRHGPPHHRLEELAKSDPARYAAITNRMAAFRARRHERLLAKLDFLASVDTSRMSKSAKKTHETLQDLIAQREELEAQIHQEGLTDAERDALMRKMRETQRKLRAASTAERDNLIGLTAETLGFTGDDAKAIASTMRDIVEATDDASRPGGGEPPPGPPPDGGMPMEGGVRK